jgi:hypothetical protein
MTAVQQSFKKPFQDLEACKGSWSHHHQQKFQTTGSATNKNLEDVSEPHGHQKTLQANQAVAPYDHSHIQLPPNSSEEFEPSILYITPTKQTFQEQSNWFCSKKWLLWAIWHLREWTSTYIFVTWHGKLTLNCLVVWINAAHGTGVKLILMSCVWNHVTVCNSMV